MTTKERMAENMRKNGLEVIETENKVTMVSNNKKMRTIYRFNEKGDLTGYATENL